jgi:threonine/homoserine/homoserine lactone efflux protein
MTLSIIYQAIIIVLVLAFSFGPAFFALINTSIKHGFKTGAALAIGVIVSDLVLSVAVCLLINKGAESYLQDQKNQAFIGILGGIVLIVFGVIYLMKKEVLQTESAIHIERPHLFWVATKGFFMNMFNPIVWPLWLGNVTAVGQSLNNDLYKMILFFSFTLLGVLSCDLLKVFVANKIKKNITLRLIKTVNWITGISLLCFGLFLIYKFFFASHIHA